MIRSVTSKEKNDIFSSLLSIGFFILSSDVSLCLFVVLHHHHHHRDTKREEKRRSRTEKREGEREKTSMMMMMIILVVRWAKMPWAMNMSKEMMTRRWRWRCWRRKRRRRRRKRKRNVFSHRSIDRYGVIIELFAPYRLSRNWFNHKLFNSISSSSTQWSFLLLLHLFCPFLDQIWKISFSSRWFLSSFLSDSIIFRLFLISDCMSFRISHVCLSIFFFLVFCFFRIN